MTVSAVAEALRLCVLIGDFLSIVSVDGQNVNGFICTYQMWNYTSVNYYYISHLTFYEAKPHFHIQRREQSHFRCLIKILVKVKINYFSKIRCVCIYIHLYIYTHTCMCVFYMSVYIILIQYLYIYIFMYLCMFFFTQVL